VDVLNRFCTNFCFDVCLSKSAKVSALCHCLCVSTAGDDLSVQLTVRMSDGLNNKELNELESKTPAFLYRLTDWNTDLSLTPPIDDNDIKSYLLKTNVCNAFWIMITEWPAVRKLRSAAAIMPLGLHCGRCVKISML
jgi:hypothetical protein